MKDKQPIYRYKTADKVKKGEKYFFVDTDFSYSSIKKPSINEETVYRVVSGDFSTKNQEDKYERIRVMAFETKEDATQYALKQLNDYKQYLIKEIRRVKGELIFRD